MTEYHAIPTRIIVKPEGEPIFSERAVIVEIADEGGGPFVAVSCPTSNTVGIEGPEWPLIREAIDKMLAVAQGLEAKGID